MSRPDRSAVFPSRRWRRSIPSVAAVLVAALAAGATDETTPDRRAAADALYEEVDLAGAARLYAELVEARPEDAALRIRLADCLTRTDRFEEAIEHAERAVALSDGGAEARAALGLALHRQGELDRAGELLREAVDADPECARCLWGLARVQAIFGEYAEAAGNFQKAAALEPDNPIFLRHLAVYVTERDVQEELYRRYLELPRREELAVWENGRAWLAMLEYAGDRPLKAAEIPEGGTEVPIEVSGGMSYIRVTVGAKKKLRYLFDTGASGFTISRRTMKRLKLKPVDAFTITGIGGAGTSDTQMVLVDEVRVGAAVIRNVPAVVADPAPMVDGLAGPTLFGGATITLDPARRRLRIGGPLDPQGDEAAEGAASEKRSRERPQAVEVPFLSINGTPFIPIRVDGVAMNAMVDTGASQAVMSPYAAAQVSGLEMLAPALAPPAYRELRGTTGAQRDVRVARRARLEIAGRTLEMAAHIPDPDHVLVSYDLTPMSHAFGTEVWAILGNPQLDDFVLRIDWGRQVVVLTPRR